MQRERERERERERQAELCYVVGVREWSDDQDYYYNYY